MSFKIGDKVVFNTPYRSVVELNDYSAEFALRFGYDAEGMHDFVFRGKPGLVTHVDTDGSFYVGEYCYDVDELKLADDHAPAAEVKSPVARIKPIYVVEDSDGDELIRTRDREYAREIKSYYGGKAKGVRIIQYAAVKEIR